VETPLIVTGLLFDMGGVLYDDTLWRRWLLRVLSQLGLRTNYRIFYRIWDRDFLPKVHRGDRDFCDAFRDFMRSAGLSAPQIEEVEAACQARRRTLEFEIRALPGVKSTLTRLRQAGFTLAALNDSEFPAKSLVERLERIGLGDLFATVVSSIDLRRTRPDRECYQVALTAMNLAASEVAFVGHDAEELAGATAIGMPTVAFNFDPDAQADLFLARFDDILDLVEFPQPRSAAA
jgi:HAD superfamily hydrolase (TIGR01509 family)